MHGWQSSTTKQNCTSPFYLFSLWSFQKNKCEATSELLMSLWTASLCSGSLEPFPTCVLNIHHWIIDYSFATINWFHWTEHLMMLQPAKWLCPAAFIFFHKYLCIFPFAKRLSASHGPEQSFWHLPRLPDGMWACGIRLCVCLCPAPFMHALINKMVLRGIQY